MKSIIQKGKAVIEVLLVVFGLVTLIARAANVLLPGFDRLQVEALGFPFPVFNHVAMALAVGIVLVLAKREFADYGIHLHHTKGQLAVFTTCFLPVVLSNMPLGMGVDYTRWSGALVMGAVEVALLLGLGWQLRKKPSVSYALAGGCLLLHQAAPVNPAPAGQALLTFLTYALFVGFGEEILYRGYVQSRLNQTFGRPYTFFGVQVGLGWIIASLIFGLTHVGVLRFLLGISAEVTWAWGFWTFFGGLVFGFVREKSGGILAPALLHGLPQAIASAVILLT